MYLLGISAFYHDSAAVLLREGVLIAAAQEERFSRVKYDHRFPKQAVAFCLSKAGISIAQVDYVVFYEKPLPKFERILLSQIRQYPRSWQVFRESLIAWLGDKLWMKQDMAQKLGLPAEKILFVEHHLSHAASAFFASPYEDAAFMTVDGVGEHLTTAIGEASGDWTGSGKNEIKILNEIHFPHSLGLLYSAFTAWLGFKVNSGEYKVMGMAPYGRPKYVDRVEKVIRLHEDGSFTLDMDYFSFHYSLRQTYTDRFISLFGPPRHPESLFFTSQTGDDLKGREREAEQNQYYADVAASIQVVTERALLNMARHLHRVTGKKNLVVAGGVGMNSVANGKLMMESPFDQVYIQPNAGDAGGALGAALYAWHVVFGKKRHFVMEHVYYGKSYGPDEIRAYLDQIGASYEHVPDIDQRATQIAEAMTRKSVVGLSQGGFEWGQRALGNRSIIADPRSFEMKEVVNTKIKFREPFRPFAPAVLESHAKDYFDLGKAMDQYPLRFMMGVVPSRADAEAKIPAVSHMGTARIQVVREEWNPCYAKIIQKFAEMTGVPVILNTSFNLRGEPMVNTPQNAMNTFNKSDLDLLVLDEYLVRKT